MNSVREALDAAWQSYNQGDLQRAETIYRQVLSAEPNRLDALHFMGLITSQTGRPSESIEYWNAVLRLVPGLAAGHHNLGNVLADLQRFPEAVHCYQQALQLDPTLPGTYNSLGNALAALGQLADAENVLRQALRLRPQYAEGFANLALVLWKQGRLDEAVALSQESLRLKPDYINAYVLLGNYRKDQGRLDEAIAAYRAALAIAPDAAYIHSNLIVTLHYHPDFDVQAISSECKRWNQQHAEQYTRYIQPHTNDVNPDRRLRVGYVSPHFGNHIDSLFTVPLLSNHDHEAVEVFCYADIVGNDPLTHRLRECSDVWRTTIGLSDQQLADLIRADQIDVLVDLESHMGSNRLLMFARKPSPVQVSWLGSIGTTGLSTMDYRLTDPYLDPPGLFEQFYSEKSIRLPETFWCYCPMEDALPVSPLPASHNGFITFGCLNNFCKINIGCLKLWSEIMRQAPQSRLILLAPQGTTRERVVVEFETTGVARSRLEFLDWLPRPEYLQQYNRIDICLDPLPCNGHTTSLDSLWMGVPLVTLVGTQTPFGRAGWSQLCNLCAGDLAADSPAQYVLRATELADDLSRLTELRRTLRPRMEQSPLMNSKRFAANMEHVFRQMWQQWCKQH
jgi:predicted O-linked N-acetylglucosamine transferase (SPINDLY family)